MTTLIGDIPVLSWGEAAEGWASYQHLRMEKPDLFRGYKTGLSELDRIIGSMQTGTYTVLVGKNKIGKTAGMLSLALPLADVAKVNMVTLEMSPLQLMSRGIANVSYTDMNVFRDLKMDDADWLRVEAAIECFYRKRGGISYGLRSIEEIDALVRQEDPDVLIVDYAQLITMDTKDKSMNAMYSQISHYFKSLTLPANLRGSKMAELEAALSGARLRNVITAVQVDKASKRSKQKVTDASARDSGAWEDDADYIFAINEVLDGDGDPRPDVREITVTGRYTEGGTCWVSFNRGQARFEDYYTEIENQHRMIAI